MKTYKTALRAILMLATVSLLLLGVLFSYQHWAEGTNLLWTGLLLFIAMIGDHYISKRIAVRRNPDARDINEDI